MVLCLPEARTLQHSGFKVLQVGTGPSVPQVTQQDSGPSWGHY